MNECLNCGTEIDSTLSFCDDDCEREYQGIDDDQMVSEQDDLDDNGVNDLDEDDDWP